MVELTRYMTHPDKKGVVAKMHTEESIRLHEEDGWSLIPEVKKTEPIKKKIQLQTVAEYKDALKELGITIPHNATKYILSKLYAEATK